MILILKNEMEIEGLLFLAQQEWFLYEHVETRSTITTEDFSFRPIRQSTYLGKSLSKVALFFRIDFSYF